jgi:hypothetical protein
VLAASSRIIGFYADDGATGERPPRTTQSDCFATLGDGHFVEAMAIVASAVRM